jgi:hypothetical protein
MKTNKGKYLIEKAYLIQFLLPDYLMSFYLPMFPSILTALPAKV